MKKNETAPTVTIRDVAKKAGYSISAVSMVLSQNGRIGKEASEKILAAARELGYRPNNKAQSLSHKTIVIGLLIPRDPPVIQNMLFDGVSQALETQRDTKIKLISCPVNVDIQERAQTFTRLCREVDGLILEDDLTDDLFQEGINILNDRGCPVVSLVSSPLQQIRINQCVSIDAPVVGKMAAQILHMQRCTDTIIFAGLSHADIHRRNRVGFEEAAKAYGMCLHDMVYTDDIPEKAIAFARELGKRPYPVDGIFVSSYLSPAVCEGLAQAGLTGRVSVVGVDVYPETAACLTEGKLCAAIFQNQREQAFTALNRLVDLIFNKSQACTQPGTLLMKPELVLSSNLSCYLPGKGDSLDVKQEKAPLPTPKE